MEEPRYNESKLRLTESGYQRLTQASNFPRDRQQNPLKRYALYKAIAGMKGLSLDHKTVGRILERKASVTYYSLERLFAKFGLALHPGSDYESCPNVSRAAHTHYYVPHEFSRNFTGRKQELQALRALLEQHKIVTVSGMGGLGKTQTALAYCDLQRDAYEYVFWIRADSEAGLQQGYTEITGHLKLPDAVLDESARAAAALRWLDKHPRWLLVLDNLDRQSAIRLPQNSKSHILITTRLEQLDFLDAGASLILPTLSSADALEFLLRRSRYQDVPAAEREAAAELAELLGFLPLAMEQAVAYISHMTTFAQYVTLYKKRKLAHLNKRAPADAKYLPTVSETLAINFEAIEAACQIETAGKHAAQLLQFSAFLAPDDIPFELVRSGAAEYCPELGELFAQAEDAAEAEEVYNEALEPLTRYSLATRKRMERTFSLHRLVQEVTQNRLSASEREEWKKRAVRAINSAFPVPVFENWALCERLLPHVLAVGEMIFHDRLAIESAVQLLAHAGWYLFECGRYSLAETYLLTAQNLGSAVHQGDHPHIAVAINYLGRLRFCQEQGEDAEQCYQQALEMRRRHFSDDHIDVAECLNNLAGLYDALGQGAQAEPLYARALQITQQPCYQSNPHTATIMHNLGLLHYRRQQNDDAERLFAHSLAIWREQLPPHHPQIATCLHNLAQTHRRQGRIVQAEPLYREALSIQQRNYPNGHPETSITHHNMGQMYEGLNRIREAEEHFQFALEVSRKVRGENHPDVAFDHQILQEFHRKT